MPGMPANGKITEPKELELDEDLNACSAYDCTGLIPSAITDESEIEAYEEIYHYLSPLTNTGDSHGNVKNKTDSK